MPRPFARRSGWARTICDTCNIALRALSAVSDDPVTFANAARNNAIPGFPL